MKIATYQGERNVSELAGRVFQIARLKGPQAKALAKAAEAALVVANPQLGDLKSLHAGALIIVPEVPGVEMAEKVSPTEGMATEIVEPLRQALRGAQLALETSLSREVEEVKQTAEIARGRELKVLGKQVPGINERLSQITEKAKLLLKEADTLKSTQQQAFAQLEKDLDEVARLSS